VSLGDLAGENADRLRQKHLQTLNQAEIVDESTPLRRDSKKNIFSKIYFQWRTEDKHTLEQCRFAASEMFKEQFSDSIMVLDRFYKALNISREDGKPVASKTNWKDISPEEIEQALFELQCLRLTTTPQINELMLEAVYAKNTEQDMYDDAWVAIVDGTQGDRQAYARRKSREDKYHAFFRYYLYSTADTFNRELTAFMYLLKDIRSWHSGVAR
jgi:hypothetical protein